MQLKPSIAAFLKCDYRFFFKKNLWVFFPQLNLNQIQTQKFKIKHNILTTQTHPDNSKSNTTYSQYKYNVLQNTRPQTHGSPLIQQNQPKSNTKSIQGTQKHKLRNTTEQAQEHKPIKT